MLISNRTSRLIGAGALLLAAPALASCTEHATDTIYTPAVGTNDRDSAVDVLHAVIVANADKAGQGTLVVTFVNNETEEVGSTEDLTDQLVGVSGDVTGKVKPVKLPAGTHVVLATATAEIPKAVPGISVKGDFDLGDFVEVVFDFKNADDVTLEVPVVENVEGSQFAGQNGQADEAPAQKGPELHGGAHGGGEAEHGEEPEGDHGTEHGDEPEAEHGTEHGDEPAESAH
jgi:copper(I)-binding protein